MREGYNDRFKDAPWFPQNEEKVLVGGAGGIGSFLSFFLTRAGFSVHLYDYDNIEQHNLSGQLFRESDIYKPKVQAVYKIVKEFCGEPISTYNEAIDENSPGHCFMFSAFDNMEARRIMFDIWKKGLDKYSVKPLFIDGRLLMEKLDIFCVTPDNMDIYERDWLFSDEEAEEAPCTLKQTTHTAAMIASNMVGYFTNHIANIYERVDMRAVPFHWEKFIPANYASSSYESNQDRKEQEVKESMAEVFEDECTPPGIELI